MDSREILIDAGKKLITERFTVETWGNISLIACIGLLIQRKSVSDVVKGTFKAMLGM